MEIRESPITCLNIPKLAAHGGDGATRPLHGGVHGDPTVELAPCSGPEVKNRSSAKEAHRRGSDVRQSRRRRVRSCSRCPQAL